MRQSLEQVLTGYTIVVAWLSLFILLWCCTPPDPPRLELVLVPAEDASW